MERSMPSTPSDKILIVPIARDFLLQTNGTTSYIYVDLDVPELEDLGPQIEAITVHTNTVAPTANYRWHVAMVWSIEGRPGIRPRPRTSLDRTSR